MKANVTLINLSDPYDPETVRFEDLEPGEAFVLARDAELTDSAIGLFVKLPSAAQETWRSRHAPTMRAALNLKRLTVGGFDNLTDVVRIRLDVDVKYRLEA